MIITVKCVTDNCPVQNFTATPGQTFACPVCHVAGTWVTSESNEAVAETPFTIEDFVAAMQEKSDAYHDANFPTLTKPTYGYDAGNKYFKVWVVSYGQKSVHCFVEKSTSHVFKANGWKAPAKGVRYATMQAAVEAFNGSGTGYLYA